MAKTKVAPANWRLSRVLLAGATADDICIDGIRLRNVPLIWTRLARHLLQAGLGASGSDSDARSIILHRSYTSLPYVAE